MKTEQTLQVFLSQPASYPEPTEKVELRETHISQVYLTDHSAYKIKKPWKLPFLDYSTLDARHAACLAEIDLNRRFSKDIYHKVIRITESDQGLAFEGTGPIVDYAVWMRRIPDDCLMDARLRNQDFPSEDKERLIAHLADCYKKAPHGAVDASVYWKRLQGLIDENRSSLYELALHLKLDPKPWQALCSRQLLFMQVQRDLLLRRVEQGFIIEGHGDLRPEHIVLEDKVSMIDGIEFNRDLRVLDQADELSFLAMECAVMGFPELGSELRARVLHELQDPAPPELLAFYEAYRALVRAKVNALRAEQEPLEKRECTLRRIAAYQKLAEDSMRKAIPAFTFLVAGAMGSGKTTLARALKQVLGAVHLESDQIRQEVLGKSLEASAYGQGHYTKEARLRIYDEMRNKMLQELDAGMNVIVDASFSNPEYVRSIVEPLERAGRPYLIVVCECSDEEAMARIRRRMQNEASPSEARPELYKEQKNQGDWTFSAFPHVRVNTEYQQEEEMRKVFQSLSKRLR